MQHIFDYITVHNESREDRQGNTSRKGDKYCEYTGNISKAQARYPVTGSGGARLLRLENQTLASPRDDGARSDLDVTFVDEFPARDRRVAAPAAAANHAPLQEEFIR